MTRDGAGPALDRVLAAQVPFAILHRPQATGPGVLDVLTGEVSRPATLREIPLRLDGPGYGSLVLVPYRQISERGFASVDDGSPLIALTITGHAAMPAGEVLGRLPESAIELSAAGFDVPDDAYADTVRAIVSSEIGTGQGANFVIKRSFTADISGYSVRSALALFRRLLAFESGAYWTFIVHVGDRTFVGASPERHVSLRDETAVMNPVSGTYRYPPAGPTLPGLLDFLADRKEADELYMVLDEELKMMARICTQGGTVTGPYLKEMARLAHTEYLISGHSTRDPRDILRETMFAPTVTGSPLESACRVIAQYEPQGRGYYSGVAALIGRDEAGGWSVDSAILIRTADIGSTGRLQIGVGSTLVRHSVPEAEAAETRAKAATLLAALEDGSGRFAREPTVRAALDKRNEGISRFWLSSEGRDGHGGCPSRELAGLRALVVDAEDNFTSMIGHQLRAAGMDVSFCRYDQEHCLDGWDLVVMGPGPGDPGDAGHPKIGRLRASVRELLAGRPFLAVCLSHQVLCRELGLELTPKDPPNQGVQYEIDLFGSRERVGFYNTFVARSDSDTVDCPGLGLVEVARDPGTGEVHALRGRRFASLQFHAESVLTQDGDRILTSTVKKVLDL